MTPRVFRGGDSGTKKVRSARAELPLLEAPPSQEQKQGSRNIPSERSVAAHHSRRHRHGHHQSSSSSSSSSSSESPLRREHDHHCRAASSDLESPKKARTEERRHRHRPAAKDERKHSKGKGKGNAAAEGKKPKNIHYMGEVEKLISEWFNNINVARGHASLPACQIFPDKHPHVARNQKQRQDKVRSLVAKAGALDTHVAHLFVLITLSVGKYTVHTP